jgi:hypothetical protein
MDGTEYITLKEASELSGYSPDYIGQLIRRGKISGKQVYANVAWVTTKDDLLDYLSTKGKTKKTEKSIEQVPTQTLHDQHLSAIGVNMEVAAGVEAPDNAILRWEHIIRTISLGLIVCSVLFLLFLFHVLSTLLDDSQERRAFERISSSMEESTLRL